MSIVSLRPRSGVEIIDASFQFLRENFTLLFTASAAAFFPVAIMSAVAAGDPRNPFLALVSGVVSWVFNAIAYAAVVVIVAKRYLGEDVTAADALRAASRRLGSVLGITFLYGLVIGFGMIFFLVPGFYFAAKYFAAMPVAMVEGYNTQNSFDRSGALTDGSKWRVLGVYGLGYFIYVIVTGVVNVVLTQLAGPTVGSLSAVALMAATYPLIAVVGTMLYFDLRIRREAFDLDMMLDPAAAAASAAG